MTNHRFDVYHQNQERPVSSHAISHKIDKLEECYDLKGIYLEPPHPNQNFTSYNIRNTEVAHQLVMRSRLPEGLNR